MIKIMNKEVIDMSSHQCPAPWYKGKNAPLGVMALLKGESHYRWVEYSLVSWESA